MDKEIRVVVICGGTSTEREVSLRSGHAVYNGLKKAGFSNVSLFELNNDNVRELLSIDLDLAFLALHGKDGEDGRIQSFLELAGIPYTGPGVQASVLCMNKLLTKAILKNSKIPTADYIVFSKDDLNQYDFVEKRIIDCIGLPAVVKAPSQGSSIGISIVKSKDDIKGALLDSFKYDDMIMVEKFVDGIEVTIPILGNEELKILPIIEIVSEHDFYDYTAKYTSGLCHHIIPARLSKHEVENVQKIGKAAYKALGCTGVSRVDFIVDKIEGPKVVEVNTIPGMTEMSLVPDSAKAVNISFEELVSCIVELGVKTKR